MNEMQLNHRHILKPGYISKALYTFTIPVTFKRDPIRNMFYARSFDCNGGKIEMYLAEDLNHRDDFIMTEFYQTCVYNLRWYWCSTRMKWHIGLLCKHWVEELLVQRHSSDIKILLCTSSKEWNVHCLCLTKRCPFCSKVKLPCCITSEKVVGSLEKICCVIFLLIQLKRFSLWNNHVYSMSE